MEEKKSKILIPTIVAVVTLIALVVGATYAYFTVGATNNFSTRTIEASADSVGVVTLTSSEDNLYLNMPAHLMMEDQIPETETEAVSYYAVTDSEGVPSTIDPNYTAATFTLTGEGTYECTVYYDLNISGTMFDKAKKLDNGIPNIHITVINPVGEYLFWHEIHYASTSDYSSVNEDPCVQNGNCSDNFKFNIGGTNGNSYALYLSTSVQNKKEEDQTSLAGTSMTVEFDITDFSCTAISEE